VARRPNIGTDVTALDGTDVARQAVVQKEK
jgi:hypothetical protein